MSFRTQHRVRLELVIEPELVMMLAVEVGVTVGVGARVEVLVDGGTGGVVDGCSGVGLPAVLLPRVVTVGFVPGGGEGVLVVFTVVGGVGGGVVDSTEEGEVD